MNSLTNSSLPHEIILSLDLIEAAAYCVNPRDTRPICQQVHFYGENVYATDGHIAFNSTFENSVPVPFSLSAFHIATLKKNKSAYRSAVICVSDPYVGHGDDMVQDVELYKITAKDSTLISEGTVITIAKKAAETIERHLVDSEDVPMPSLMFPEYLGVIAKVAKKLKVETVDVVTAGRNAARIGLGKNTTMAVMPMGNEQYYSNWEAKLSQHRETLKKAA